MLGHRSLSVLQSGACLLQLCMRVLIGIRGIGTRHRLAGRIQFGGRRRQAGTRG
jgi:hypothetical protein